MTDTVLRVIIDPSGAESGAKRVKASLNRIKTSSRAAEGETRKAGDALDKTGGYARRAGRALKETSAAFDRERKAASKAAVATSRFNKTAQTTTALSGTMGRALTGIGAGLTAVELVRLADANTRLQSRLALVTNGVEDQRAAYEGLLRVSNETRTDLNATGDLFVRLAQSTEQLGLSTEETLGLTKTLSQAFQVSGASAQAAGSAALQFAQGIASGQLRGEELNSVLEQTPRLAQAIAEGLGITVGQLREFAQEGQLTAEKVLPALQSQARAIGEEFAKLAPTVESSFVVLRNNIQDFIKGGDDASGVSKALAEAVLFASRNVDELAAAMGTVAAVKLVSFLANTALQMGTLTKAFGAGTLAARAFGTALTLATGPLGLIVGAATAAGFAIKAIADNMNDVADPTGAVKAEMDKLNGALDTLSQKDDAEPLKALVESAGQDAERFGGFVDQMNTKLENFKKRHKPGRGGAAKLRLTEEQITVLRQRNIIDEDITTDTDLSQAQYKDIINAMTLARDTAQEVGRVGSTALKTLGGATEEAGGSVKGLSISLDAAKSGLEEFQRDGELFELTAVQREIEMVKTEAKALRDSAEAGRLKDGSNGADVDALIARIAVAEQARVDAIKAANSESAKFLASLKGTVDSLRNSEIEALFDLPNADQAAAKLSEILGLTQEETEKVRALIEQRNALARADAARTASAKSVEAIKALDAERQALELAVTTKDLTIQKAREQIAEETLVEGMTERQRMAYERQREAVDRLNVSLTAKQEKEKRAGEGTDMLTDMRAEIEAIDLVLNGQAKEIEQANILLAIQKLEQDGNIILAEQLREEMALRGEKQAQLEAHQAQLARHQQLTDGLKIATSQFLTDSITGTDGLDGAFRGLVDRLRDMVIELLIIEPLMRGLSGGFGGGNIFGTVASTLISGFASGGGAGAAAGGASAIATPTATLAVGGVFDRGFQAFANGAEFARGRPQAFANGAEFARGNVRRFAEGGAFTNSIVDGDTYFDMGLMGEAGPEAILPLTRIGGDLGVKAQIMPMPMDGRASGGGGKSVNIIINNEVEVTTGSGDAEEIGAEVAAQMGMSIRATMKQIAKQEILTAVRPGGMLNRG